MQFVSNGGRRLRYAGLAAKKLAHEAGRIVTRRELSAAAREAEMALGLRPAQRQVLSELVACWGEQPLERLLVWPSNQHLAFRTGLTDRAIRRIIAQLTDLGLVVPKDSPNGKRYAVTDLTGSVIDAFGIDLTPVFARRGEWTSLLAERKALRAIRKRAHDEVTIARRAAEEAISVLGQHSPWPDRADLEDRYRRLMARTPARSTADLPPGLLQDWQDLKARTEDAFFRAGNGGLGVRHIETDDESSSRACYKGLSRKAGAARPTPLAEPFAPALIVEACPALNSFWKRVTDAADLVAAGRYLRASLGAHESAWNEAVAEIGPVASAVAVIYVLQLYDDDVSGGGARIRNPGGYFRAVVRMVKAGKLDLRLELEAMRHRRNRPGADPGDPGSWPARRPPEQPRDGPGRAPPLQERSPCHAAGSAQHSPFQTRPGNRQHMRSASDSARCAASDAPGGEGREQSKPGFICGRSAPAEPDRSASYRQGGAGRETLPAATRTRRRWEFPGPGAVR